MVSKCMNRVAPTHVVLQVIQSILTVCKSLILWETEMKKDWANLLKLCLCGR